MDGRAAKLAGVEVIGDLELFARERRRQSFDVPFIAITGTNGKSTTTALTAHILAAAGRDVQVGGNIGTAMLSLEAFAPRPRTTSSRCSSYPDRSGAQRSMPTVGMLLNVTPDHLDRHGTIENYAAVKARLRAGGAAAPSSAWTTTSAAPSPSACADQSRRAVDRLRLASALPTARRRMGTEVDRPRRRGRGPHRRIRRHRRHRLAARARTTPRTPAPRAAALLMLPEPLTAAQIAAAMRAFPGLPHRMEELGRQGRTLFVNDSKATNADSAEKALLSFPRDIYWILGGKPKEGGIASLRPLFPRIAKAYLIGEATEEFAATLDGRVPFERCGTLDAAAAPPRAMQPRRPRAEPVVLLSPACASYRSVSATSRCGATLSAPWSRRCPASSSRGDAHESVSRRSQSHR